MTIEQISETNEISAPYTLVRDNAGRLFKQYLGTVATPVDEMVSMEKGPGIHEIDGHEHTFHPHGLETAANGYEVS